MTSTVPIAIHAWTTESVMIGMNNAMLCHLESTVRGVSNAIGKTRSGMNQVTD